MGSRLVYANNTPASNTWVPPGLKRPTPDDKHSWGTSQSVMLGDGKTKRRLKNVNSQRKRYHSPEKTHN